MTDVLIENLHKRFPSRAPGEATPKRGAINGLDLHVRAGEFFVLLGPSGCGKTTTLRCIAGLEEPTEGVVKIAGKVVSDARAGVFTPPERRELGMMFQSYALWPHMTVAQNVAYPLERRRLRRSRADIAELVAQKLYLVGLDGLGDRYPTQLSGGQQQRVALARALVGQPRLLLFDEPLSNLDAQLRVRLRQDLRRIHQEAGSTSIYVTHDQAEAFALADRVAIMKAGRLEQLGTPTEVFLSPATRFVAEFMGYENILPGRVQRLGSNLAIRPDGWREAIRGRAAGQASAAEGEAFLAVRAGALHATLTPSPQETNTLPGVLRSVTYAGDRYLARVEANGMALQATLSLDAWPAGRAASGETVYLSVRPSDAVIIPAEDASEAAEPGAEQAA